MAETVEEGAPVAKDAIDPDLIKLKRKRPKVGVITAAGLVFLCSVFLVRLNGDRKFSGASTPTKTTVAEVLAGNVGVDRYVSLDAEPLMSHAIRATAAKGNLGYRVTPVRGTGDRLWLVLPGDGWEQPATGAYVGRLRKLSELPFAKAVGSYAAEHPRPVFVSAAATRAAFGAKQITTVSGDTLDITDADQVAFDVAEPTSSTIIATFTRATEDHDSLMDTAAWTKQLAKLGMTPTATGEPDTSLGQVRFEVPLPVAEITAKLEGAKVFAARIEPVTRHYKTTWATLRSSTAAGFNTGTTTVPDASVDLVGVYLARSIPGDAYALITDERPQDYWYVLPITIGLAVIGLVFAWALIRAVRRDLLPPARAG